MLEATWNAVPEALVIVMLLAEPADKEPSSALRATPVVGLLQASMPFLAFNAFVYLLGAIEIVVAVMLLARIMLPYAGLIVVALFAGTLTILLITPSVTNIPTLSLVGQFLLKDLGLMAAAVQIIAMAPVRESRRMAAQAVTA